MIDPYLIFTAIRDKPLTILVAMILLGGYANYTQLEDWCNYSRPILRQGLKPLLRLELVKPVTQSKFMVTDQARQLIMFDEKLFQFSSSILLNDSNNILDIESTTTNRCKSFSALPKVEKYLKSRGVWVSAILEIAEIADNDLTFLKAHFEGTEPALAIHRIRNQVPSKQQQETDKYLIGICKECASSPCECEGDE